MKKDLDKEAEKLKTKIRNFKKKCEYQNEEHDHYNYKIIWDTWCNYPTRYKNEHVCPCETTGCPRLN